MTLADLKKAAEACNEAALDAGCHAFFDQANAAYAAMYAAKAALTGGSEKEVAAAAAEAVAEAAADAAVMIYEGDAARVALRQVCANVVRRRIDEATILSLWQRHFRAEN